jgi:hypothetical protein
MGPIPILARVSFDHRFPCFTALGLGSDLALSPACQPCVSHVSGRNNLARCLALPLILSLTARDVKAPWARGISSWLLTRGASTRIFFILGREKDLAHGSFLQASVTPRDLEQL